MMVLTRLYQATQWAFDLKFQLTPTKHYDIAMSVSPF